VRQEGDTEPCGTHALDASFELASAQQECESEPCDAHAPDASVEHDKPPQSLHSPPTAAAQKARDRALSLLGQRAYTRSRLAKKLLEKKFPREAVEWAVASAEVRLCPFSLFLQRKQVVLANGVGDVEWTQDNLHVHALHMKALHMSAAMEFWGVSQISFPTSTSVRLPADCTAAPQACASASRQCSRASAAATWPAQQQQSHLRVMPRPARTTRLHYGAIGCTYWGWGHVLHLQAMGYVLHICRRWLCATHVLHTCRRWVMWTTRRMLRGTPVRNGGPQSGHPGASGRSCGFEASAMMSLNGLWSGCRRCALHVLLTHQTASMSALTQTLAQTSGSKHVWADALTSTTSCSATGQPDSTLHTGTRISQLCWPVCCSLLFVSTPQ
jgi:hypothetical protein